ALLKGVTDAGVEVPVGEGAYPSEERITGKTIADYASGLATEDKEAYQKFFSGLLKSGFKPEEYPAQFAKTKSVIAGDKK
ncbi:MAG TPA: hypothetical protein VFE91_01010, partial [Nitrososphaerales archaeon]|nr:hypothetical protein [Nitrososphaerales archaeon]